jgi:hypothetical protein
MTGLGRFLRPLLLLGLAWGGQIGAELTDFVFILNTKGSRRIVLASRIHYDGWQCFPAAGPLGRNAEAAGSASMKAVAAIFTYSKTKGPFAGISLEGSAIVERRETNRKFYGNNCTAKSILSGRVDPPPECDMLFRLLESRVFRGARPSDWEDDHYYNDIPEESSDSGSSRRGTGSRRRYCDDEDDLHGEPDSRTNRRGTWQDDEPDGRGSRGGGCLGMPSQRDPWDEAETTHPTRKEWEDDVFGQASRRNDQVDDVTRKLQRSNFRSTYSDHPGIPIAPRRLLDGEQGGDLSFRNGDVITIVKKSEAADGWWTGNAGGEEGNSPPNYVELMWTNIVSETLANETFVIIFYFYLLILNLAISMLVDDASSTQWKLKIEKDRLQDCLLALVVGIRQLF